MGSFNSDLKDGELIEQYLVKYLFPKISVSFDRLESMSEQYDEGDIRATIPDVGDELLLDVKAQTTYINNPRESFVLELDYLKHGQLKQGWFYDNSKATEYYLFVWISDARRDNLRQLSDIETAKCLLVSRQRLQKFLAEEGHDRDSVEAKARQIREQGQKKYIASGHDDFFYYLTNFLDERPLNIVMKYDALDRLSEETYVVEGDSLRAGERLFG
ncbi:MULTISPECIES: hypothetical protein [Haloferax]|uniref:Uncharacterized protein n=2 Tax=Haloferax TaxID=2251 RepID=A0A6G1Z783_9EURY|nr:MULTISPECIES: hypothetical protein [Haloferax]KAB1184771.1 hypothetical protein Hfx1149_17040 [Haloferax sp. CBA1149]MRW82402.1 hypothetical protein [Haloferax marinisediminis]